VPDIVDPATRSRIMSRIRGKDTVPEMRVRRFLHRAGLRYRLHLKTLPGKPDLVFSRARTVVFVHGCFWHQHQGCPLAATPSSNRDFWRNKLASNVERDERIAAQLSDMGWQVEVVWECEPDVRIGALAAALRGRGHSALHRS
jgi:DNA mismatch endonuclease (patch repair protein)